MADTDDRGQVRRRSRLGRSLMWVTGTLLGAAVLILIVLKSELTLGWRQHLGEELARLAIGAEARIDGDVNFELVPEFSASISDLTFSFEPGTAPADFDQAIGLMSVKLPYRLLLGSDGSISELTLADTRLILETEPVTPDDSGAGAVTETVPFLARLPSILLGRNFIERVSLTAMTFTFVDPVNGWDQKIELQDVQWEASDPSAVSSSASGAINDVPVSATLSVSGQGGDRSLVLSGTLPGLSMKIDGSIDPTDSVSAVDVRVTAESGSLRELASIFEIRADFEGDADASLRLAGPLTQLDMTDLDARLATPTLPKVTIAGQALDLSDPRDVRLAFDADLALSDPSAATAKPSLLEFDVEGVSGVLTGRAGELSLEDGTVRTNLATVAGNTIGPISVGRVVKNADETVGLEEVRIQYGPPDRPLAVIAGSVTDLLTLSGLDLSGTIDVPVAELVQDLEPVSPEGLGDLKGSVSVSNSSGAFRVTDLKAGVSENDLIDLAITMPAQKGADTPGMSMGVSLSVSDLGDLAKTLGNTVDDSGPLTFDGTVTVADSAAIVDADLAFLNSDLAMDIDARMQDATAVLKGAVKSKALSTDDLAVLVDTVRDRTPDDPKDADQGDADIAAKPELWSMFRANVDFEVAKLLDQAVAAGDLSGSMSYSDRQLDLKGLSVSYLGGTITGDYGLNFANTPMSVTAKGKIEKWQLGSILSDFMSSVPVTGTLYMSFDVHTTGKTIGQMAKSLSGPFRASLWSGHVQTRLLDLTGLNLVTWLFGKGSDQKNSKLVCAVLPLQFKNGAASGNAMVVETENVQIVGGGSFSLRNQTLNLSFVPRAKAQQAIEIVSPFSISGTFSSPHLKLQTPAAARAIGETLALPFNILGQIVTKGAAKPNIGKPCRPPKK